LNQEEQENPLLVERVAFTLDPLGNLHIASEMKSIRMPAREVQHMQRWLKQRHE
jgi:hypothetical protein